MSRKRIIFLLVLKLVFDVERGKMSVKTSVVDAVFIRGHLISGGLLLDSFP
jgi:hypothetical protein